jgi:hypothetical protein
MAITYFVALPFDRNEEGELVAGEAREAQTESAARRLASFMAAPGGRPLSMRRRAFRSSPKPE